MRFSSASLLAFLAVSSTSLAAVVTRTTTSINPDPSVLQNVAARNVHARAPAPAPMTNAQRMARGLPPKAPTRRSPNGNQPQQPRPSSVPPTSIGVRGNIYVTNATDHGAIAGYLTPAQNSFGEYKSYDADKTKALDVSFSFDPQAPNHIEMTAVNGPASEATNAPFFGLIEGFSSTSDLGAGSFNYLFLGSVAHTAANAVPAAGTNSFTDLTAIAEATQSSIWQIDTHTGDLTCQWVNSDGTTPPCTFVYTQGQYAVVGDITAFQNTFGPAQEVDFQFVRA